MQLLLLLTIFCPTASAGILPPDSIKIDQPDLSDLSDLQKPPSLSTIVSDNHLIYNGLPLSKFAGPSDALTLPSFSDRDNDRTSFSLVDPDDPGSISIASVDLGESDIQTFNSELVKPSNSKGDVASLPDLDSDEVTSTDPSFISSIALAGVTPSRQICRPRNRATSGEKDDAKGTCINLDSLYQYKPKSNVDDPTTYTQDDVNRNNEVTNRDDNWVVRRRNEGFPTWDEDHSCEHAPGKKREYPFCCLGPYVEVTYGQKLKARHQPHQQRYEKRFPSSLNAGNCILYALGRPRCHVFSWQFCCYSFGAMMRWGFWGIDCVLMNP